MQLTYVQDDYKLLRMLQSIRERQSASRSSEHLMKRASSPLDPVTLSQGARAGDRAKRQEPGANLFSRVAHGYLREAYASKQVDMDAIRERLKAGSWSAEHAGPAPESRPGK